ncbi:hypothetical protein OHB26_03625 [Nocardia sp. NBC_01503]|uniref:hypothetical protein n=1 Tax=Nocardia sp. NBC_01503 TaxID=2975997 RepID=UPI002E7B4200|nr:hypothetical protein [Nocardia sp. NBC_01503]WTL33346.1 hypothetical protein OHB26_03625 [Nocardia sp. NBC_01503]
MTMPRRPSRAPEDGQASLLPDLPDDQAVIRPAPGRHSAAAESAISAEIADGTLTERDAATLALVRAGMWALDTFEAQNKPYGPAKIVNPILDALKELRMTPETRAAAQTDALQELLRELATPDTAAPIRDEA